MNEKIKIDLHTHTTISDGSYTPYEVIDMAAEAGVAKFSISDHDTIEAYKKYPDLFGYSEKKGIELVSGIEISTRYQGNKYHIIGLMFDLNNEELNKTLKMLKDRRVEYVKDMYQKCQENGYIFDLDEILKEYVITKAHIARYIIGNERNKEQLKNDFGTDDPRRGEYIETFMLKGQKCFVKKEEYTPKEAIGLIKKAGGVALLAHPTYNIMVGESFEDLTRKFEEWGVDGYEAYNIQFKKNDKGEWEEVDMIKDFEKYCLENNLLISGGTDFHMYGSNGLPLGSDKISIPLEYFEKMKKVASERKNK